MPTYHNENNYTRGDFERLGKPGKFIDPLLINSSTTVNLTGSNYGYGAFQIIDATNVELTASNGTGLVTAGFPVNTIHEVGLSRVKIGATGKVYVYKRQM